MTAFFFNSQFKVVAAFADHAAGVMAFTRLYDFKDRMVFWSRLGYEDRVMVLDERGQTEEIKIMPEVYARMALGIMAFQKAKN